MLRRRCPAFVCTLPLLRNSWPGIIMHRKSCDALRMALLGPLLTEPQAALEHVASWSGHAAEAWVARFDLWRPDTFYSGGDDSAFCSRAARIPRTSRTTRA